MEKINERLCDKDQENERRPWVEKAEEKPRTGMSDLIREKANTNTWFT